MSPECDSSTRFRPRHLSLPFSVGRGPHANVLDVQDGSVARTCPVGVHGVDCGSWWPAPPVGQAVAPLTLRPWRETQSAGSSRAREHRSVAQSSRFSCRSRGLLPDKATQSLKERISETEDGRRERTGTLLTVSFVGFSHVMFHAGSGLQASCCLVKQQPSLYPPSMDCLTFLLFSASAQGASE